VLKKTRFIRHFEGQNEKGLSSLHFIDDTVQLAAKLMINILRTIGRCRSYRELKVVYDKLVIDVLSKEHGDGMSIIHPIRPYKVAVIA